MKPTKNNGIVMKVTDKHIVLLCDDGTFQNIPRKKGEVPLLGERLTIEEKSKSKSFSIPNKGLTAIVLAAVLFLTFLFSLMSSNEDYAFVVAMDINPSIEVYVDEDLHVVDWKALNEDGERILNSLKLSKNDHLYEVTELILDTTVAKGYLRENEVGMISTTFISVNDNNERISDKEYSDVITASLQENQIKADIFVYKESEDFYEKAKEEQMSVNKFRIYETLQKQGVMTEKTDIESKSIKDLVKIEENELQSNDGDSNNNPKSWSNKNNNKNIEKQNNNGKNNDNVKGNGKTEKSPLKNSNGKSNEKIENVGTGNNNGTKSNGGNNKNNENNGNKPIKEQKNDRKTEPPTNASNNKNTANDDNPNDNKGSEKGNKQKSNEVEKELGNAKGPKKNQGYSPHEEGKNNKGNNNNNHHNKDK